MKVPKVLAGTLLGLLGTALLLPAVSSDDTTLVMVWAPAPVVIGTVVGLLIDLGNEPPQFQDPTKTF
jgi:type III secretory pathway component EscS